MIRLPYGVPEHRPHLADRVTVESSDQPDLCSHNYPVIASIYVSTFNFTLCDSERCTTDIRGSNFAVVCPSHADPLAHLSPVLAAVLHTECEPIGDLGQVD